MISEEQVRGWALALPESEEHAHFGRPSFRTRKRIFATLPDERTAVLKLPLDEQEALVAMAPETFSLGGWSHQGWTHVNLRRVEQEALRELLETAWRGIATKRAQRTLDGG